MTHSKFEKYAASKITQHQTPVDADALWQAVAPETPKKKRRGILWFYMTGLLLTGIISAIVWNGLNASNQNENSFSDNDQIANTAIAENQITTEPLHPKTKETRALAQETSTLTTKGETSNGEINHDSPDQDSHASVQISTSKTITQPHDNYIDVQNNITFETSDQKSNAGGVTVDETDQLTSQPRREMKIINAVEPLPLEFREDYTSQSNTLPLLSVTPSVEHKSQSRPGTYPVSKHRVKYSIAAYGGISGTSSTLEAKSSNAAEYLTVRNQTEKQLETMQFGIEFGADVYKGIMLKTGIEMSRIARVFTFNDEITVVDSVYGLKEIFVNNQTQDTINVYGQIPVMTTTAYQKTTYNNISQIDIPFKVGYSFLSEGWHFGIDLGTVLNLKTTYSGEIFSPDGAFYSLSDDTENWFNTDIKLGFTAGLNVGRTFGNGFELYLNPVYRSASIVSTEINPINQTHARLGVNLGIRYSLNRQ